MVQVMASTGRVGSEVTSKGGIFDHMLTGASRLISGYMSFEI
jgi:hypothetical protein